MRVRVKERQKGGLSMKKIQILLSTYNGDRHLRAQLDSFLQLENADEVSVLIRDDGSTDGTRAILAEYAEKHGFQVILGENVGLNASMQLLFENADPECLFYAYADQDDVWLPAKLSRAVSVLEAEENGTPLLYAARSHLTDADGNVIGETLLAKRAPSLANALVQNVCIGHTQVYNQTMLALLRSHYHEDMFVIDHWAYLIAAAFGKVILDKALVTLYRQHGKNSIGYGNTTASKIKNRIRRARAGVPKAHAKQMTALFSAFGDELSPDDRKTVSRFLTARKSFFCRLGYLLRPDAYRQGLVENMGFRLLYLLGSYNDINRHKTKR